jgi:hypothetical protein
MGMPDRDWLDWARREREDIKQQLEWLESGKLCLQEQRGIGAPSDTTAVRIEWLRRNLTEVEAILAKHSDA